MKPKGFLGLHNAQLKEDICFILHHWQILHFASEGALQSYSLAVLWGRMLFMQKVLAPQKFSIWLAYIFSFSYNSCHHGKAEMLRLFTKDLLCLLRKCQFYNLPDEPQLNLCWRTSFLIENTLKNHTFAKHTQEPGPWVCLATSAQYWPTL